MIEVLLHFLYPKVFGVLRKLVLKNAAPTVTLSLKAAVVG